MSQLALTLSRSPAARAAEMRAWAQAHPGSTYGDLARAFSLPIGEAVRAWHWRWYAQRGR